MTGSMYTKSGCNLFEISSLIQKAIRRSNKEYVCFAANEMIPRHRNYLWKRLLCVSAEDCYDLITERIVALKQADENQNAQNKSPLFIEKALGILLSARKNRDADYFACNLLNSRDAKDLAQFGVCESGNSGCNTKNGHDLFIVADLMERFITSCRAESAGYFANEILVRYRAYFWKRLIGISGNTNHQNIANEIVALKKADDMQPTTSPKSSIFAAKALTVLLKVVKYDRCNFYVDVEPLSVCLKDYDSKRMAIPDYVFDCHTHRGKQMGRTKREFIVAEQSALTPYLKGEFDELGWDRFFYLCEKGFYDKENVAPRPDDKRMKEIEDGCFQQSLFD